jgi:hypothetical protein
MRNIGFFSSVSMIFTITSLIMVTYVCFEIYYLNPEEIQTKFGLSITEEDRTYKYWEMSAFPVFCATMMNLFEGNQMILNLYAETDDPKNFMQLVLGIFVVMGVILGFGLGIFGYLTFGNTAESTILFNMPHHYGIGIAAKLCYLVTIMGSYVLVIQPIFYVMENSEWYKNIIGVDPVQRQRLSIASNNSNQQQHHFEINSENSSIRMEPEAPNNLEEVPAEQAEQSSFDVIFWSK